MKSIQFVCFSDVFEEVGIPTSLFHGGFGLLTHRQIRKPTFHLYAFMNRLLEGSGMKENVALAGFSPEKARAGGYSDMLAAIRGG